MFRIVKCDAVLTWVDPTDPEVRIRHKPYDSRRVEELLKRGGEAESGRAAMFRVWKEFLVGWEGVIQADGTPAPIDEGAFVQLGFLLSAWWADVQRGHAQRVQAAAEAERKN